MSAARRCPECRDPLKALWEGEFYCERCDYTYAESALPGQSDLFDPPKPPSRGGADVPASPGSENSREAAAAASPTRGDFNRELWNWIDARGSRGATWAEYYLSDANRKPSGMPVRHHGTISGALSTLSNDDDVALYYSDRDRKNPDSDRWCGVYVTRPEYATAVPLDDDERRRPGPAG